jgi:localization factor PodJL
VLKTISARLERLPEQATAASGDLDSKLERIAQLLEDPRNGGVAFAHVQQSLRTIEERLEELRRDPSPRSLDDDAQDDIGAVVGIARALSDDVGALKTTAEASERKTKDALDAVQGTLEAVVKRMAFLERDVAAPAMPVDNQDAEDRGRIVPAMLGLPVIPTLGASLDDVSEDRRPRPDFDPAAAELPLGAATKNEAPRETGGLFSRLTSSQLLKRATGGRAESFSPEGDEVEEAADQPLEPGTNAPLDSALTGAPSSDTALMSGDRHKRRAGAVAAARAAALDGPDAGSGASIGNDPSAFRRGPPEAGGDDFLSAARRAAQAAAAEVADAEREAEMLREGSVLGRMGGFLKRRRRVVLASAVAVALALAALQIVRNQMDLGPAEVASLPAAGSADAVNVSPTEELAPEPEPELTAAQPAPAEPAMPEPTPPPQAEASAPAPSTPPPSVTTPPADAESIAATGAPEAVIPSMAAEPAAPVETAALPQTLPPPPDAGLGLPSAGNIAPDAGVPTSSVPAAVPGSPADLSGLPAPIGPDRLRNAAADGDPVAAFEVGSRYAEGRGVVEDMSAAIAWYTRAAESGLAPAQYRLGSIYEKGLGVPKDLAAAQTWYTRAADAGNVKAMHNLAVLHAEGAGGEPDLERAAGLFRKAADHGVRDSQFNLAILHARGLGVPQDLTEAFKWFAVAASSGDPESSKRRDIIAASLSSADLAKAEAAAASFQPQPLATEANDVLMPDGGWGDDTSQLQSPTDLVALVQGLLAEKGYDPGPADGVMGQKTVDAIKAFQEAAGLEADGEINAGLVAALEEEQSS